MGKKTPKDKTKTPSKEAKPEPPPWSRIHKGGWHSKADDREVDEAEIERLLRDRMDAKARKDFAAADGLAKELQDLGIAYLDDKREWYTKVVVQKKPEAAAAASSEEGSAKRKRDDSSKPAIEVSTEGVDGVDDDDAPTSSDDDSEDDREDDAFVARMEAKLMVGDKKLKSEVSTPGPTKKAAAVAGDSTPKTTKSAKKQKK